MLSIEGTEEVLDFADLFWRRFEALEEGERQFEDSLEDQARAWAEE